MKIISVAPNSIGEELNIKSGDELIAFDGIKVTDILDYEFYSEKESFTMTVETNGEIIDFEIEKDDDENLGLEFNDELEPIRCKNKCMFCFVDQLPKQKLRETLHVKDDDYRHSFISGNYVTLTNLKDFELERIKRLRLSPLYISVHSAFLEMRNKLLGVKHAPDIMSQIKDLSKAGISLHAQIVYCPNINEDYAETAEAIAPYCESLAIVPVGLTKDSNKELSPVTELAAKKVIEKIEPLQKKFLKEKGTRFVFLADEFYLKANAAFPLYSSYEDFPQIDNGVGLVAQFKKDADNALSEIKSASGEYSIATGVSAYPLIKEYALKAAEKLKIKIDVYKIINTFFGDTVTVAGLVTGGDIISQLLDKPLKKTLILPRCMLRQFHDVFLDDSTVSTVENALGVKIKVVGTDGESFIKAFQSDGNN